MWTEDKRLWRKYQAFRRRLLAVKTVRGAVNAIKRHARDCDDHYNKKNKRDHEQHMDIVSREVELRRFYTWKDKDGIGGWLTLEKRLFDGKIKSMYEPRLRKRWFPPIIGFEGTYAHFDDECVKYFVVPKKGKPHIFDRLYTGRSEKNYNYCGC